MTKPMHRNKRLRKVTYRAPSANIRKRIERRTTTTAKCGLCEKKLQAVTTDKTKSKTQKTPTRKFAGTLCHKCTETIVKLQTRLKEGLTTEIEIEPIYRKYI